MKALVFWTNGVKIGEVQKMDFEKANRDYRQPELIYEVIDVTDCKKNELDYKKVLGNDFNYITDSIGTTWYDESYVCLITESQYSQLIQLYEGKKTEEILISKIKKDESLEIELKNQENTESIFNKAKETGIKQEINNWSEPCDNPKEECNLDIVTLYALPNGETEKIRNHTW